MKWAVLLGCVLVIAGLVAVINPSFSYTRREKVADVGPVHVTADHDKQVTVPRTVGATAIGVGVVLLIVAVKRS